MGNCEICLKKFGFFEKKIVNPTASIRPGSELTYFHEKCWESFVKSLQKPWNVYVEPEGYEPKMEIIY